MPVLCRPQQAFAEAMEEDAQCGLLSWKQGWDMVLVGASL